MSREQWTSTTSAAGNVVQAYVHVDPADDAIMAVRRLRAERDANALALRPLEEIRALLQELDIPAFCASGQALTFAQRIALAALSAPLALSVSANERR